jgi:Na+:H+ antiporter, NhaA family
MEASTDRAPLDDPQPQRMTELAGAVVLTVSVLGALVWANSAWGDTYGRVWGIAFRFGITRSSFHPTLRGVINDGLMSVFFLAIGLELGRERREGSLGDLRSAVVPVAGAFGGMGGAALVYVAVNRGGPGSSGWGIPMATDIAFALGALALLGRRVPRNLRLFLLTLAVADDVGSVLVLAIFYPGRASRIPLLLGAVVVVALMMMRKRWRGSWWPYCWGGVVLWVLFTAGGVESSLSGVVVGLLVPGRSDNRVADPAERLERRAVPLSTFVVLPLFALANSGVMVDGSLLRHPGASRVFAGIAVARIIGKVVGITGACALVARLRLGRLPEGVKWIQVIGAAAIAGIGFTVPLLFAERAFTRSPSLVEASRAGLLVGSAVALAVGVLVLVGAARRSDSTSGSRRLMLSADGMGMPAGDADRDEEK